MSQDSRTIDHVMRDIKNLTEYQVQITIPEGFKFSGVVPFDMTIVEGVISAKVLAIDFDESVNIFDKWLETCK